MPVVPRLRNLANQCCLNLLVSNWFRHMCMMQIKLIKFNGSLLRYLWERFSLPLKKEIHFRLKCITFQNKIIIHNEREKHTRRNSPSSAARCHWVCGAWYCDCLPRTMRVVSWREHKRMVKQKDGSNLHPWWYHQNSDITNPWDFLLCGIILFLFKSFTGLSKKLESSWKYPDTHYMCVCGGGLFNRK